MAESTLSLQKADLERDIAIFLGWPRTFAELDADQQATMNSLMKSGYSQFLHPPKLEGEASSYDWSFTKPTATLLFASGASTVTLPDDFGGFEGQVTVLTTSTTSQPWAIEWRNEGWIRQAYSTTPSMTGPPMFACPQPLRGTSPSAGQRQQLLLFPLADQAYTLQVPYYLLPDALTTASPFAYGGGQHSETLKASCIAAAELYLDDAKGPRWAYFMERLSASVSMDRRNKPQKLGKNLDMSDVPEWWTQNPHYWAPAVSYSGS